jgi:hypothetical protein
MTTTAAALVAAMEHGGAVEVDPTTARALKAADIGVAAVVWALPTIVSTRHIRDGSFPALRNPVCAPGPLPWL